jgi:hypothetical protein
METDRYPVLPTILDYYYSIIWAVSILVPESSLHRYLCEYMNSLLLTPILILILLFQHRKSFAARTSY